MGEDHWTYENTCRKLADNNIAFAVSFPGTKATEKPTYYVVHVSDSLNNTQIGVMHQLGFNMSPQGEFQLTGQL